jgi:hypothetical protein
MTPDEILTHYADGPARLEAAIAGLTETDLDSALASGTWTIRQLVHHVVDGDDLWKMCIKQALGNSESQFDLGWYWNMAQDRWAESWNYAGRALKPSLALFRASRGHVVQLVRQIAGAWECSLVIQWPHQERGRITVGQVIEMQARHVDAHVEDIRKIRQAHSC